MNTRTTNKTIKPTYSEMKYNSHSHTNIIKLVIDDLTILFDVVTENALKIEVYKGDYQPLSSEVIINQSLKQVDAKINSSNHIIKIQTNKMLIEIDQLSYHLSVYNSNKDCLLQQTDLKMTVNNQFEFKNNDNDMLYGIRAFECNQDSTSQLLRTGNQLAKGGHQGYAGAPFVWSTAGYGILIDTVDATFDLTPGKINISNTSKEQAHYYIIVGTPIEIQSSVAKLSGTSPMLPKWAMGFSNSEWEIDEKELLSHIETYREKQIPIDMFTLDFDWKAWGECNYGEFRWNDQKFPNGSSGKLKEQLDQQGIKLTGILKPRIHVDTTQGQYATNHQFWFQDRPHYECYFSKKRVNDLNFELPEVRKWYFDHIKEAFDLGIIGYWNDEQDEGYPSLQGLYMQKALYEGQRQYTNQRVWSINRNFYLGAQRYAYPMWSGDICSDFYTMQTQRERMLSTINLGQVKWGMDIGGFQSTPSSINYARWMQFGAFVPIYRVHGTLNQQRQPWFFGEKAERVAKEAIKLRYSLIPYIYSYEHQAYETGIGIVKPLLYDFPNDLKLTNLVESWMFGDYLLVSPVLTEKETNKTIYLPQGKWIDYHHGNVYEGNQIITHTIDLENWLDLPLFIKEGAIIPTQEVMNYIGEKKIETIEINVFPSKKQTCFNFYDDDGLTYDYETSAYFKQVLTTQRISNKTVFTTQEKKGNFVPTVKNYHVKIHGQIAKQVTINGQIVSNWTQTTDQYGDVTIIQIETGKELEITIES